MTVKRVLYIVAAVLFFLAVLVAVGTITGDSDLLSWQALVALGLCSGAVGDAA